MASVERTLTLKASADAVWDVIGDFGDLSWHPAPTGTSVDTSSGAPVRTIALPDGSQILERETGRDRHGYSYTIISSPMPVADYHAALKVEDAGAGASRIIWSCTFTPEGVSEAEACEITAHIYEAGLQALKERF